MEDDTSSINNNKNNHNPQDTASSGQQSRQLQQPARSTSTTNPVPPAAAATGNGNQLEGKPTGKRIAARKSPSLEEILSEFKEMFPSPIPFGVSAFIKAFVIGNKTIFDGVLKCIPHDVLKLILSFVETRPFPMTFVPPLVGGEFIVALLGEDGVGKHSLVRGITGQELPPVANRATTGFTEGVLNMHTIYGAAKLRIRIIHHDYNEN